MAELRLTGCTLEPLMSYLKALGVFRLVGEQGDTTARARWDGEGFVLDSKFGRDELLAFFMTTYRPTAILAPWNGGSGFYGGGSEPIELIEHASGERLAPYRDAICIIRGFIPASKPKDAEKERLLIRCRAELPDHVVPWIDTCFVLTEGGAGYFPLLGTGGNDGRLDFTNNFMQRLRNVIPFETDEPIPEESRGWLASALYADELVPLGKAAVGQFNPGGIGGANGVQGDFEAGSRVNPWDFVLMIEGAILFAGSVARRLDAKSGDRATFPFTVQSVAVGYGSASASDETTDGSRAELWLPLWEKGASLPEVVQLFAEGRAQFGRRQARTAVDFALAVCTLGVGRGIDSFARYGFLKRNGLSFIAAPLGRIRVQLRPDARLLDDPNLTPWIDRLRSACRDKDKAPARYQTALRNLDRAIFAFANRAQTDPASDRKALLDVLIALGRAERTLATGLWFCADKNITPLQRLKPDWLLIAKEQEHQSPSPDWREFRLAAALASILGVEKTVGPLRVHLEEVEGIGRAKWFPGSTSAVWSNRPLVDNLAAIFLRRWLETERAGGDGVALKACLFAPLADVIAFLNGETDGKSEERLADLLWALIGIDWQNRDWFKQNRSELKAAFYQPITSCPCDFALLRLLVHPVHLTFSKLPTQREGRWRAVYKDGTMTTTPTGAPFQLLARSSDHQRRTIDEAIDLAANRLWSDRLTPFGWENRRRRQTHYSVGDTVDPKRLLAACLFPISRPALGLLANRVLNASAEGK